MLHYTEDWLFVAGDQGLVTSDETADTSALFYAVVCGGGHIQRKDAA